MASVMTVKREPDMQLILARLQDPEPGRRVGAVVVLANMGPHARGAFPALVQTLRDRAPDVRRLTIAALLQLGGEIAPQAVTVIVPMLHDPDLRVRRRAIMALGELGPTARSAVNVLLPLLQDPDDLIRRLAAATLGEIGPTAPNAIPALIECLRDDDMKNRAVAQAALVKMGPRAVPRLIDALRHTDARVRRQAALVLARSPRGRDAITELHLLLEDPEAVVRDAARTALSRLQNARS